MASTAAEPAPFTQVDTIELLAQVARSQMQPKAYDTGIKMLMSWHGQNIDVVDSADCPEVQQNSTDWATGV